MSSMNGMIYNTISVDGGFDSSSLFIIYMCIYIFCPIADFFTDFCVRTVFWLGGIFITRRTPTTKKNQKKKYRKRCFDSIDTLSTVKEDTKYSECRRLR